MTDNHVQIDPNLQRARRIVSHHEGIHHTAKEGLAMEIAQALKQVRVQAFDQGVQWEIDVGSKLTAEAGDD